jgi:hypothetical protein
LASQTDAGAYAVTIVGDSMWPRFRPGRRLAIAPMVPVAIGDDVLVKLNARPHQTGVVNVLIKELVRKTARDRASPVQSGRNVPRRRIRNRYDREGRRRAVLAARLARFASAWHGEAKGG